MMLRRGLTACCLIGALGISTGAHAQARRVPPARRPAGEPRAVLSISGGVQSTAGTISDHLEFDRNYETETIDVTYPKNPGTLVDVGLGVRLWKRLGIGFAVGHVSREGTANVTATVPHPFFFNQPRTVTGSQGAIAHEETGIHLQVQYVIPAAKRVRVVLGAGPSRIKLTEDVITGVNVIETYPYDTAALRDAVTKGATASVNGFNGGVDVTWKLTRNVGFGGLVRYTRANADLDVRSDHRLSMKAGGAQGAAGIRFAF